jgi:Tfp pilus assembly protein PilX
MDAQRTRLIRRITAGERGVALPVALSILFLVASLTTVAAKAGVVASHFQQRDRNVTRALQAATAGVEATIYQLNLMQPKAQQCVIKDASSGLLTIVTVSPDGWCGQQSEDLGDGASYTTRASAAATLNTNGQVLAQRKIVSTGTINGVKRRIMLTTNAATGAPLFPANYAAISLSSVDYGNSVFVNGGVGSNGNITLRQQSEVCGAVTPGPGSTLTMLNSSSVCPGYSTSPADTKFQLAPVDQQDAPNHNYNSRICVQDTCTGAPIWNPTARTLTLNNSDTITLTGNIYSLCQLKLNNTAQLKIAPRTTPLRIIFDTPENCGAGSTNYSQLSLSQNTAIVNLNNDPTTLQIFVTGSPTKPSSVNFDNTGDPAQDVQMVIYAPQSTIAFTNSTRIKGSLVAKSIQLQNSVTITYDSRVTDITSLSSARLFDPNTGYKDCTAVPTSLVPDSGC